MGGSYHLRGGRAARWRCRWRGRRDKGAAAGGPGVWRPRGALVQYRELVCQPDHGVLQDADPGRQCLVRPARQYGDRGARGSIYVAEPVLSPPQDDLRVLLEVLILVSR